tara:strand:+ start:13148 stop:13456 length:309 start_codon:yes stop_codon:yes gene_type:complete
MNEEPSKKKIDIELDNDTIDGVYSNLVVINHSSSEFILDFVIITPGATKAKVKSRVILTPEHAKRLNYALNENLIRYEQSSGEIKIKGNKNVPINFGPKGEA